MSEPAWTRYLWNALLAVLGLALLVLVASLVMRGWDPAPNPVRTDPAPDLLGDYVQVEVRNGTMQPGAAATARSYLVGRGFDVVASGNWTRRDEPQTLVLDRVGNRTAARHVARALGLDDSRIQEVPDGRFFVDVTVVLGADLDALPPFRDPSAR